MNNEEKIIAATLRVVKKHTISGTRMHLIADETGMLQSNLHYYYKTKEELMLALQQHVLNKCLELREKMRKHSRETLEAQLDIFIRQKREFILMLPEYDYAEMDFWSQGRVNPEMKNNFIQSFDGWRQELGDLLERFAPELTDEVKHYLPYQIVSYLEGATLQYLIDEKSFDLDKYFEFGRKMILTTIKEDLKRPSALSIDGKNS